MLLSHLMAAVTLGSHALEDHDAQRYPIIVMHVKFLHHSKFAQGCVPTAVMSPIGPD